MGAVVGGVVGGVASLALIGLCFALLLRRRRRTRRNINQDQAVASGNAPSLVTSSLVSPAASPSSYPRYGIPPCANAMPTSFSGMLPSCQRLAQLSKVHQAR